MTETAVAAPIAGGRHDFDFLFGTWRIHNRKLVDPLAEPPNDWIEFEAWSEARPILSGLGNVDTYGAPDFPGRPGFEALTLRLFEPETGLWRIWWASTVGHGQLDTPVVGRFGDGRGVFECDDVLGGRDVRVRYEWLDMSAVSARWRQSFSFDAGKAWHTNWLMDLSRSE